MLDEFLISVVLLPLALGIIEITHMRSRDVILARIDADTLAGADLSGAFLLGAQLSGMLCAGTSFRNANLTRAELREADLSGADLRGADLSGANLLGTDLSGALYNSRTIWPAGFDPRAHGARADE